MKRDFLDYIEDIWINMKLAQDFLEGVEYTKFVEDIQLYYAIERALEIIGEATKRIPKES